MNIADRLASEDLPIDLSAYWALRQPGAAYVVSCVNRKNPNIQAAYAVFDSKVEAEEFACYAYIAEAAGETTDEFGEPGGFYDHLSTAIKDPDYYWRVEEVHSYFFPRTTT